MEPSATEVGNPESVLLEQKYSQLGTDKCRLLNSIDVTKKKCKLLQHEINQMLDLLAESISYDALCRSNSILSDSDLELFTQRVAYEDESEGEDLFDMRHEREVINNIKAELERVKRQVEDSGKRASSPVRRTPSSGLSKSRRSYKYLPVDEDGNVELPLILGRALNRISITNIGTVINNLNYMKGEYIFPEGYECRRKYFTFEPELAGPEENKSLYTCRITGNNGAPVFEMTLQGYLEDGLVWSDSDTQIDQLWDRFVAQFPKELHDRLLADFPTPESFFGFDHENLSRYLIEKLEKQKK